MSGPSALNSIAVAAVTLAVCSGAANGQAIIYVDDDASLGGDGTTWQTAFRYLQDALALATEGDEIRVAGGGYRPDQGGGQTPGNRGASFALILGVELYGGYAGRGAPDPDERNVDIFESILSGDLAGNDGPNYANNDENAFHVLTGGATDSSTVVDGFTVVGGNADANNLPHDAGGAMRIQAGSPTICNCVFTGNSATFGGGMENFNGGNPTIIACLFVANRATFRGGGIHNNTSSPILINTVLAENVAANSGGGMRNWNFSAPVLTRCEFVDNHAGFGGGMVNDESFATLRDCIFRANTADDTSGGMHNWISNPVLVNCLFVDNEAITKGGGIYSLNTSAPTLTNCTLSGNFAGVEGGGLFATGSSTGLLLNCIVWGNTGSALGGPGTFTVAYSNIEGGSTGAGNIDTDPLFVDAAGDNLRLSISSPCIDAADNTAVPLGVTTDLDDNPRFVDDPATADTGNGTPPIVDMGAYEFLPTCGNGVVDPAEECDDAGESATCDPDCTVAVCGDGTLNTTAGEECDDEDANSDTAPDACRTTCALPSCGDAVVDASEECDDGNTESADGCDETCQIEFGACCVGTACDVTTEAGCSVLSGSFFGFLTTCDAPDADGDGLRDECDGCPADSNKIEPGICGCGVDDTADLDDDGVPDCMDRCPGVDDAVFAPHCESAIPTTSQWGLIVLTLLLLAGGKIYFGIRA